jgi:hypothetical protein
MLFEVVQVLGLLRLNFTFCYFFHVVFWLFPVMAF